MAVPLDMENLRQFILLNNRAIVALQRDPYSGCTKEYLWGARFVIKLLARQWAYDIKARRHQTKP